MRYLVNVGTYSSDTDGSQFGILALRQLMRQVPLLRDSRKQVSNRIEFNVGVQHCAVFICLFISVSVADRKWPMVDRLMTSLMTSRDPKRSRS